MPRRPDMPPLRRRDLAPDPIAQFASWFELAEREVPLWEAITLASVDETGAADARMVLLKGFDERGFRFFTNERSAKGRQLRAEPRAAIVVYWRELDRQVRIRGEVERLAGGESDAYFATRPRESQLGAWASPQSERIEDRGALDSALTEARERFAGAEVARPPHWGGFLLAPREVEFWQGRVGRLHDRFLYERDGAGWRITRLAP